ncbi:MAG: hypothetical protein Q9180_001460 [Flavoplaca navasiana]
MQTIHEEDERTQTMRAASKKLVTAASAATESSTRAIATPPVSDHPSTQTCKAGPILKNNIPETRPPHLRNIFTGAPSNLSPPSTTASKRPIYDNQVPGIPTHWIPIYGAGHGLFYDPIIKLFHGDGSPRSNLERSDGSMPEMDTMDPLPRFGEHREDCLHVQPRAVTDPLVRRMQASPILGRRYYCRCQRRWLAQRHECPDVRIPVTRAWSDGVPQKGRTVAIRPGDTIPASSFTHELAIGDRGYLTPGQRYTHDHNLPMPTAASAASMGLRMQGNMKMGGA